jgi:pyruvate/2-oxoacid:ferredoxin oxidoreductase alpha subunit
VDFPEQASLPPRHKWGVHATRETRGNILNSIYLDHHELEDHNRKLQAKYAEAQAKEVAFEEHRVEDADLVVIGYGIVSRVLRSAIAEARKTGLKVGLLRPITLWPFPTAKIRELARRVKSFLVVELSNGQMVDDVRLAVNGGRPVEFYGRMGGVVPTTEELLGQIESALSANE